jgi:hypothetical protein
MRHLFLLVYSRNYKVLLNNAANEQTKCFGCTPLPQSFYRVKPNLEPGKPTSIKNCDVNCALGPHAGETTHPHTTYPIDRRHDAQLPRRRYGSIDLLQP